MLLYLSSCCSSAFNKKKLSLYSVNDSFYGMTPSDTLKITSNGQML